MHITAQSAPHSLGEMQRCENPAAGLREHPELGWELRESRLSFRLD